MFFRRTTPARPSPLAARASLWQAFAERLELAPADFREEYVRELIYSEDSLEFASIYGMEPLPGVTLLLFDYLRTRRGPLGEAHKLISNCLLSTAEMLAPLSLRADPRQDVRLESLGAAAAGGEIIRLEDDPDFSHQVTLYARNPQQVHDFLTAPLKRVILQIITRASDPELRPSLKLGEQHLLLACSAQPQTPTNFDIIEGLTTDALSLYSALKARHVC